MFDGFGVGKPRFGPGAPLFQLAEVEAEAEAEAEIRFHYLLPSQYMFTYVGL